MPVDKEEIATPEKMCIGLLIGANCLKALEPMQVIASENGGPYTFRTRLGWCIVGPIMKGDNKDSLSCHQVAFRDASASHVVLMHSFLQA